MSYKKCTVPLCEVQLSKGWVSTAVSNAHGLADFMAATHRVLDVFALYKQRPHPEVGLVAAARKADYDLVERLGRLKCSCRYRVTRPVEFAPAGRILHRIGHSALEWGYKPLWWYQIVCSSRGFRKCSDSVETTLCSSVHANSLDQ